MSLECRHWRRTGGQLLLEPEQPGHGPRKLQLRRLRHLSNTTLIARSPVAGNDLKGRILGGWQLSPSLVIASGMAINITSGKDNSLNGIGLTGPTCSLAILS